MAAVEPFVLLVCGGRRFDDREAAWSALDRAHERRRITLLVHGGASGADTLADEWAKSRRVPRLPFKVDAREWNALGRKAGPLRNERMLAEGRPDAVLALPGYRGTRDMIGKARAAGLPVWEPYGSTVFVFGSNLAGRHGAGAAKTALLSYGAEYGVGVGRTGDAYAIPTKDADLRPLPLPAIAGYVSGFLAYARENPDRRFKVTRVGCGYAGYTDAQIGPMFADAPRNCVLPDPWHDFKPPRAA